MELQIEIVTKEIPIEKLMEYYKYEEVLGYCQNCSNYQVNYSCPGFSFSTSEVLKSYSYATLILTKVSTDLIKEEETLFSDKKFPSRVLDNYNNGKPKDQINWQSALAMSVFEQVKNWMTEELLGLEEIFIDSMSVPPGSCTRCAICKKSLIQDCAIPDKLRYSLEALGFLVSDIYKDVFNMELQWVKGKLPETFNSCSALFSKKSIDVDRLQSIIESNCIKLRI